MARTAHLVSILATLVLVPSVGAAVVADPAGSRLDRSGFTQDIVVSGLDDPTAFVFLPGGRILIAEKSGVVRIVVGGKLLPRPFIDLRERVNDYYERGLLGIAADPDFAANGYVYLYYAYENDPGDFRGTKTARLTRVTAEENTARPASEAVVLGTQVGATCKQFPAGSDCIPSDWYGHSTGDIAFAPDGTLYVSVGEASSWLHATEDSLRAQDVDSLAGKILHVTRSGKGLPSNPFWNGNADAARSKVWAYGVRNAYRIAVRPGSGALYAGDVGSSLQEEIDVVPAGSNLGWPCYEGTERQPKFQATAVCQALYAQGPAAVQTPLVTWPHGPVSSAVTGGKFSTGRSFPKTLRGAYFYGDFVRNVIRYLKVDAHDHLVSGPVDFADGADGPVDLQVGPDGDLYYLAYNAGQLRRIRHGPPSGASGPAVSGLLGLPASFAVGATPHSVVAADVNHDGRLDLVAAAAGDDAAAVLLGTGRGTFGPVLRYATGKRPKFVLASDLNGDGKLDLASANQDSSSASVLLGHGDGTFGPATDYPVCSRAHEIAAGDVNGDRRPDLAVACWNGTVVSVLLNTGDGTFSPAVAYESGGNPHSLVVRDLNRDRKPDLAVANHGGNDVSVLLGRGDGTFKPAAHYAVHSRPHAVRAADLNGDGRLDLVTANDGSNDVSVLLGNGDGTFRPATSFRTGSVPKSVAVADLNGDGRQDVVTANTGGNGDGVTGNPNGDKVSVLLGTGTGRLRPPIDYFVGQTPFSVVAADLDGDGRPDLATANWDSGTVTVLLNRSR